MGSKNKLQVFLKNIYLNKRYFIKDLFFPRWCVGCGIIDTFLCLNCKGKLIKFSSERCLFCGAIEEPNSGHKCKKHNGHIGGAAYCYYKKGPAKDLVLSLKFNNNREVGVIMGRLMGQLVIENKIICEDVANYLVVPVPLDKKRLNQRGYNQSYVLAREIGHLINCKVEEVLAKKRISPQLGLSKAQRKLNVKNAFTCMKKLTGKKVILVDDVLTTGSTVKECIKTLKKNGAKGVYVVVFAKD
jgi:competence protein ComFC